MSVNTYRPDIDGLRAIAVLAVVLYHYGLVPLHGGFVGVDVFFVISGYLITGIIHKEITRGQFTFSGFYERRVRRIFPALFVVLLTTLVLGVWMFLPSDLLDLGKATIATLMFGSNILFWRQGGYFATSSDYNPLLHTWSLAVEEQFYIAFPIVLIFLARYFRGELRLKLVLAGCAIVSFGVAQWVQILRPDAVFYLSPLRAWELLVGAMLAIGVVPRVKQRSIQGAISWIAFAVLLWSLCWIDAGPDFPGWRAAIPVLATAVLLHVGADSDSMIQKFLELPPIRFIGLISYSLYLWHWPLLVFARYHNGMQPLAPWLPWILLAVSLALAAATYRWVETPARHRNRQAADGTSRGAIFGVAAAASAILAGAALAARLDGGWKERFEPEVLALDAARHPLIPFKVCDGVSPIAAKAECKLGVVGGTPTVLLWGDSHALAWAPAFDIILKKNGKTGVLAVMSTCPPLIGVKNPINPNCYANNRRLMSLIRQDKFDTIAIVAWWQAYSSPDGRYTTYDDAGRQGNTNVFAPALRSTVTVLARHARHVVVIGDTPGAPRDIPFAAAIAAARGAEEPPPLKVSVVNVRMNRFWTAASDLHHWPNVDIVDPRSAFAVNGRYCYRDVNGRLLYRDGDHLSLSGAEFVENVLRKNSDDPHFGVYR